MQGKLFSANKVIVSAPMSLYTIYDVIIAWINLFTYLIL